MQIESRQSGQWPQAHRVFLAFYAFFCGHFGSIRPAAPAQPPNFCLSSAS